MQRQKQRESRQQTVETFAKTQSDSVVVIDLLFCPLYKRKSNRGKTDEPLVKVDGFAVWWGQWVKLIPVGEANSPDCSTSLMMCQYLWAVGGGRFHHGALSLMMCLYLLALVIYLIMVQWGSTWRAKLGMNDIYLICLIYLILYDHVYLCMVSYSPYMSVVAPLSRKQFYNEKLRGLFRFFFTFWNKTDKKANTCQ